MANRLRKLGVVLALLGLAFAVAGGVAFAQVWNGQESLQAFSEAQGVELSYNVEGQLVDRGTVEGAQAILTLLEEDWGYPVNYTHLNPDDPLINTPTEYMFQMATIGYHILHGTQTVVLESDVEYEGVLYEAGTYEFDVDGRYWTDFDRSHPLEGPARSQAWSGTAHGLFGELGVGAVTASTLALGFGLAGAFAGLAVIALLTGFGLIWVARARETFEGIEISSPKMADERVTTS
ncbi:MAG: hypothetical protein R3258_03430 [Acidimicrobiia bacterium]|nr:hypothetical protein [Acidimicrobiia bacterium]